MINDRATGPISGPISSEAFTILLVDNDGMNRKTAIAILNRAFPSAKAKGTIEEAVDGKEFLDKLRSGKRYDFIILDDLMDVVNGSTAIVLWRMLELKNVILKTQIHKDEFIELKAKFEFLNDEFEVSVRKGEFTGVRETTLRQIFRELSELSAELEIDFRDIEEKSPTGDQNPRQVILAWSTTAQGHPKGYTGADVRLAKPLAMKDFRDPQVLAVIHALEKKKVETVEDINAPEADAPEASDLGPKTQVSNLGLFKDRDDDKKRNEPELAEPTQGQSEPSQGECLSK